MGNSGTAFRAAALLALAMLVPACSPSEDASTALTAVSYPAGPPAGQWTWHAGSQVHNQPGVYGVLGEPGAANTPGARMQPAYWRDAHGGLRLFGGRAYDEAGNFGRSNDLWRWNGTAWAWVMGSKLRHAYGTYGTLGVAAASNTPGARDTMGFAADGAGGVWIYGGTGYGATNQGELSDLWRFDGAQWTWVAGSSAVNVLPVHGTKGVAHAANQPGGREQSLLWVDAAGRLWLFGGYGLDSAGTFGHLNDLWKYEGGLWTWVKGSTVVAQPGIYGVQGTAAAANTPGARGLARGVADLSGALWLFGGYGRDSVGSSAYILNDLWKFDGTDWTWVKGSNLNGAAAVYGTMGVPAAANTPAARVLHAVTRDNAGALWMTGGDAGAQGYVSDVWKFDGTNWAWMAGGSVGQETCVYGTQGVSDPSVHPGARGHSAIWFDPSGRLWIFGGEGFTASMVLQMLNDLWRLTP